jgi:dipeptidyl aminopeptidase/acylaminoacyl peptidase
MLVAAATACAVAIGAAPHAQSKRFITETDLLKFTWIADPQLSPDGTSVAFVRVVVNEKENRYETSIDVVPASASATVLPRRLTSGTRDLSPRWSPDGKRMAFVRTPNATDAAKTPASQIYLLEMDGGEARAITDLPRAASAPVWSPDGKAIAFTASAGQDGRQGQDGQSGRDGQAGRDGQEGRQGQDGRERQEGREGKDTKKSDVQVVTKAVYRANGNPTYVDGEHHSHLFVVRAPVDANDKPVATQITDGEFDESGQVWSADGSTLYFVSTRVAEPYYEEAGSELYRVAAGGGAITKVASIEGSIGGLSLSPDGKQMAFVGTLRGKPIRSYSQSNLWIVDVTPGSTPKNLTASYDFDIAGGIGGDQAAPRGQNRKPIVWSNDGASLVVASAERGSSNLRRISIATGKVEPVTDGAQDVVAYSASRDATKIAATLSTQTSIGELFLLDRGPQRAALQGAAQSGSRSTTLLGSRQITHVNDDLFKGIQQSEPEEIWYKTFDGKNIQGWILKPPDFDASKKYPLILEIHGGPHAAYGNVYTHEFQWMAAKGYVVLFTNPRGSTSYGQDFGNIIQYRYPGDDYKDLMAGVDEVLKKGYVDPNRLGVTGGSGGGLLTNWTITQTQRFKAAVAQRDIADWYGFWFTADFTLFQPTWFRKAPWEDPQDFAARSPITHVANVTTPLMLVNGDWDYRTPPADGGEMMFRALKYRKIPTVMVRFPRESHELSRSGEPQHRVERLQHIVGWMDQWLQGRKNAAYATQ